jgi:enediyne biosynthesis protein E4
MALRKVSRGLATADYDNDGDLEILVSNMNSAPELLRHLRKHPNHSILVKPIGVKSNRDGIGAEVKAIAGDLTQYDTVRSGGSYLSSSDLRLHFGLGNHAAIDRIEIRWPRGQTQKIANPPVDHILMIKEGEGLVASKPFRKPRAGVR